MKASEASRQHRVLNTAVAYVSRHLDERFRVRDISAAAGVSTRTLEYLFMRVHAVTPMAFVKHQRLIAANRLLQHADPSSTTVARIARSCGFTHMGQFAMDYKRSFGELPSATLCPSLAGKRTTGSS
jgi:transcriptional regulator GlxA family with amidase domain